MGEVFWFFFSSLALNSNFSFRHVCFTKDAFSVAFHDVFQGVVRIVWKLYASYSINFRLFE